MRDTSGGVPWGAEKTGVPGGFAADVAEVVAEVVARRRSAFASPTCKDLVAVAHSNVEH